MCGSSVARVGSSGIDPKLGLWMLFIVLVGIILLVRHAIRNTAGNAKLHEGPPSSL